MWHPLSLVSTSSRAEKEPHEHGLGLLLCPQPRLTSPPLLALHLHALPSEAPMVWSQALSEGQAPAPCCLLHRPGVAASPMGLPCTRAREGQQPPRAVTSGISALLREDTRDRQPGAWGRRCHGPRGQAPEVTGPPPITPFHPPRGGKGLGKTRVQDHSWEAALSASLLPQHLGTCFAAPSWLTFLAGAKGSCRGRGAELEKGGSGNSCQPRRCSPLAHPEPPQPRN